MKTNKDSLKILILDDEPDLCWSMEELLRYEGHEVKRAESGKEARDILQGKSFDLAFVDIKLLDDNGLDIADLIKHRNPHAEVILISGYYIPDEDSAGLKITDKYKLITKPFDLDLVEQAVQRISRDKKSC